MSVVRLQNELYRVDVERTNGRIVSLFDHVGGYDLVAERRLAENFRLLLPQPDCESNYIFGKEQRLASVDKSENALRLEWKAPLHSPRGRFDVGVVMWIEFVGEAIHFRC